MNQTGVALKFARLLNEARLRLQANVDQCGECKDGVVTLYGPNKSVTKEECTDCKDDREFLARCTHMVGPVLPVTSSKTMAPA